VATAFAFQDEASSRPSADPDLRQGTVVWKVNGGQGHFEGASGLITSNLLLSLTGDLTENQLGVIFAPAHRESK
jgi:hypothetical protein